MGGSRSRERWTIAQKIVVVVSFVVGLSFVGILVAYWWTNTVPSRPKSVRADAVFIWAPHVGVPVPRRGWWIACWESEGKNWCSVSWIDGTLKYQGEFIPYRRTTSVPTAELIIDAEKTQQADGFWLGETRVRLVYLTNGDVLIPAERYQEGKRLLSPE